MAFLTVTTTLLLLLLFLTHAFVSAILLFRPDLVLRTIVDRTATSTTTRGVIRGLATFPVYSWVLAGNS